MNGFNQGPIGVPFEMMTPDLFKRMYKNAPPGVMEVFNKAQAGRKAEMDRAVRSLPANAKITRKPGGGFVALSIPEPRPRLTVTAMSKGSEMPAATATKPKPATVSPSLSVKHQAPRHVVPTLKAFHGPNAAREAYAAGQVLLASVGKLTGERCFIAEQFCRDHGYGMVSNLATESNPTAGGYLVDNPLSAAVIELKAKYGVSRQLAEVYPMSSNALDVPKETAGFTVRYPDEGQAITPNDLEWGLIHLEAMRRAIVAFMSNELMADAVISMTDLFIRRAAAALAAKEDDEFVNGDGTSTYGNEVGLRGAIGAGGIHGAATGHDTWAELDLADFVGCMAKLPSQFSNGAESWLCSPAFYAGAMLKSVNGAFQGMDANGRPLFLGKPVFLTSKAPTTAAASTVACYYGSFAEAVAIGDRIAFQLGVSEHVAFAQDLTALRGMARYDINCHELGDATSAGAVVALATAS